MTAKKTLQMIKDAGFSIESEIPLDDLLVEEKNIDQSKIKELQDLRPFR